MKCANIKNEFKMVDIKQMKNLHCWSVGEMEGQQIAVYLAMDLQEVLGETDCTFLLK